MNIAPNSPKRILGTDIWAGSEAAAFEFISSNKSVRTVICMRRDLPNWWAATQMAVSPNVHFLHCPVPSINCTGMGSAIHHLATFVLPSVERPVLVFCLEGRNRTGILAGFLRYSCTGSLDEAFDEYRERASSSFRNEELSLLKELCAGFAKS